jgi:hypothetical protein
VWNLLADIDSWSSWNPDIKEAKLTGGLNVGSIFRWKSGPGTITSALEEVEPHREIGWSGRSMGIIAVHVHRLEPSATGTRAHAEESFDGLMVRVFKGAARKSLQKGINGGPGESEEGRRTQAPDLRSPSVVAGHL